MANDLRLSSAATPDDLDKAFASAKKALSLTGIDMAVKKPDAAKVSAKMTKKSKPAEFMLSCSGDTVTLSIECDGKMVVELGEMSIDFAKDRKKAMAVVDGLLAVKLIDKAEAEKRMKGARTGPDAGELNQKIVALRKDMAADMKISSYDDAKRDKVFFTGLTAHCKLEFSLENLDFLAAVEKKLKRDKIMEEFIGDKAKREVNISAPTKKKILAGGDLDDAVDEIKKLVSRDALNRYKSNLADDYKEKISALEAEIKALK